MFSSDEDKFKENWLFAFLWALQTNSLNVIFWTVVHIISSEHYKKKVLQELDCVVGSDTVTNEKLKQLVFLKQCVMEAIRLHSPGMIIRKVVKDFNYKGSVIQAGNDLCISPFLTHHNSSIYSDPYKFKPERFSTSISEHSKLRYGFIPFGAGTYKCPGQYYAFVEILSFLATFFQTFDLRASQPKIPPYHEWKIVGIHNPTEKFQVQYHKK